MKRLFSKMTKTLLNPRFPKYNSFLVDMNANSWTYDFQMAPSVLDMNRKVLITCEHASNDLPEGYSWSEEEVKGLKDEHWAYDPGSAEISLELGYIIGCKVVLSRVSRLLMDVNRPLTADSLTRQVCDERLVSFNRSEVLTDVEVEKRIDCFYLPYYFALKKAFIERPEYLISLHSFTKNYEGNERTLETGVLYSFDKELAEIFMNCLKGKLYKDVEVDKVKFNQPYSGTKGLMYSIDSLISAAGHISGIDAKNVMMEFRNDLLIQKDWRTRMINDGFLPFLKQIQVNNNLSSKI